jgi:paraquat-inducible protein B
MSLNIIIKKEKLYSLVWFVPVIALCLAISLIYSSNFNKGPVITLILNKADGL